MKKLINWMNKSVSPVLGKVSKNPWVAAIQDTMIAIMPMIFVGSIITILSIVKENVPSFPDFWLINSFSFGLVSLFVAFLVPYNIMAKKGHDNIKIISGLTSFSLFLMLLNPTFTDDGGITFVFERFGSAGMFVAIIAGLFVAVVMNGFAKMSFFKKDSVMPDFVKEWFDSLIPITMILLIGWIFTYTLEINLYDVIISLFSPLAQGGHSFGGFVMISFVSVFLYSFGISPWVLIPITYPIVVQGIADNAALVAQGLEPVFINTWEVYYSGWVAVGGLGSTLVLVIMMMFSKSNKLKAVGKATIVPSLFNINEPVVYGASIAWNPILMIPFWINGIVIPALTYIALKIGIAEIPSKVFGLWYVPFPISTYIVAGLSGLILLAILVPIMAAIWYPFFKVYEAQEVKKENSGDYEDEELELELELKA